MDYTQKLCGVFLAALFSISSNVVVAATPQPGEITSSNPTTLYYGTLLEARSEPGLRMFQTVTLGLPGGQQKQFNLTVEQYTPLSNRLLQYRGQQVAFQHDGGRKMNLLYLPSSIPYMDTFTGETFNNQGFINTQAGDVQEAKQYIGFIENVSRTLHWQFTSPGYNRWGNLVPNTVGLPGTCQITISEEDKRVIMNTNIEQICQAAEDMLISRTKALVTTINPENTIYTIYPLLDGMANILGAQSVNGTIWDLTSRCIKNPGGVSCRHY